MSILVPVYGTGQYIERCAESLFEQTYQNIEFVFVDDCTPDDAIQVLDKVVNRYPDRAEQIKVIHHQQNKGISATRNTALRNATGDFVVWVDSDDFVEHDMVSSLVKKQMETEADVVVAKVEHVYAKGTEVRQQPLADTPSEFLHLMLQRKVMTSLYVKLWRNSIYKDNKILFPDGNNMDEDGYVNCMFLSKSNSIAYVDEVLYHYDCSRDGTASWFNVVKNNQAWKVFDLLKSFIQENTEFGEELNVWAIHLAVGTLINSAKDGKTKDYYKAIRRVRLNNIDEKYWKEIEPLKRFVLYVNSYNLNKVYFRFMAWMKHSVLKQQSFN